MNERGVRCGSRGTALVEFAIVVVVFLLLAFGGLEFARMLFQWDRTIEATRAGVRAAIVSDPPSACATGLPLDCPGASDISCQADAESEIALAMQRMQPAIQPANINVTYACSGTGFPDRPDPIPVVTVEVQGLVFNPILPGLFGLDFDIPIPAFPSSQTGEDLEDTPIP